MATIHRKELICPPDGAVAVTQPGETFAKKRRTRRVGGAHGLGGEKQPAFRRNLVQCDDVGTSRGSFTVAHSRNMKI